MKPLVALAIVGFSVLALKSLLGKKRCRHRARNPLKYHAGRDYGQDGTFPHIRVRFDLSPEQIAAETDALIRRGEEIDTIVGAVSPDEASYKNVVAPIAEFEGLSLGLYQACEFPSLVSPHKAVRDASREAERRLDAFIDKRSMRKDVYQAVKAVAARDEALNVEERRLVKRLVRDFERLGLNLSPETQADVEQIKFRIAELCTMFNANLNEENTVLEFTPEELQGLPEDYVANLPRAPSGRLEVALKFDLYFAVMKKCKQGGTRQRMEAAFSRRCIQNSVLVEELLELRHQMAALLGYKSHAEYVLAIRMARHPQKVMSFLNRLSEKITSLAECELQALVALKKEVEGVEDFCTADFRFYMNLAEERQFAIDHEAIRDFFPLPVVTAGMFDVYQRLLGLVFVEIPEPHVWHREVRLFAVYDAGDADNVLGYFYLDLFPREGKYINTVMCPLQPGCVLEDGRWQKPVAAMLANFSRPTGDKPSLLLHNEVETYFHEFGHLMQHLCSRAQLARFAGCRVEHDFVESPSKMLETWCWEEEALRLMSRHYKTNEPLPDDLLRKLLATKKAHAGLLTKRQVLFGIFDQAIHSGPATDPSEVLAELHPRVMLGIPMTKNTNFAASFHHVAAGYDASYYSYLWSEVLSADMFATKFKGRVLSHEAGREFREQVLQPGGSLDAEETVRRYLGREPNEDAFLESKGLVVKT